MKKILAGVIGLLILTGAGCTEFYILGNEALVKAKIKARDANRMSHMRQVQTALEMFYTDQRTYPAGKNLILGSDAAACLNQSGWHPAGCTNAYMSIVPADPQTAEGGYYRYSLQDKENYTVTAKFEDTINNLKGVITVTKEGIK